MTNQTATSLKKVDFLGNLVLAVVMLGIFLFGYLEARDWPFAAGLFPRFITIAGVILSLAYIVVAVRRAWGPRSDAGVDPDAASSDGGAPQEVDVPMAADEVLSAAEEEDFGLEYAFSNATGRQWSRALGWLVLYFTGLWLVGTLVITGITTVLYMRLEARVPWLAGILYAGVLVGVLWASVRFLGLTLPEGLLLGD